MSPTENRQIADLKDIVEEQGEQIKMLVGAVTHIREGNDRIEVLLIGDKFTKNKGLIDKVDNLDERQTIIEKTLSTFKSKWAGIVFMIIGISGVSAFVYYITSIIHTLSK